MISFIRNLLFDFKNGGDCTEKPRYQRRSDCKSNLTGCAVPTVGTALRGGNKSYSLILLLFNRGGVRKRNRGVRQPCSSSTAYLLAGRRVLRARRTKLGAKRLYIRLPKCLQIFSLFFHARDFPLRSVVALLRHGVGNCGVGLSFQLL